MKIIELQQGTTEWHSHRAASRNASEAAVMLGLSKKATRADLIRMKAIGTEKEVSDWVQKNLFDKGHEVEALARPNVEAILNDELYPVTATSDDGYLSASFDGIVLDETIFWENKTHNKDLEAFILKNCDLPDTHWPQLEQGLMVSNAEKALFTLANDDGSIALQHWYSTRKSRQERILAGWKQFDDDVKNYQHTETKAEPTGKAPELLPALHIEVKGMVTASNIDAFKSHALAVFGAINKDLQTDGDFADAEKTVKWCKEVEDKLEAAKQHALSQTADIDALFRAIDDISAEARRVRLDLDKLVKTRKENIRIEIMREAETAFSAHVSTINARLKKASLPASIKPDFVGVMKGKKTVQSLRDACDGELARAKIEASQQSEIIGANLETLEQMIVGFEFLFIDAKTICQKQNDDLVLLIKSRIADHKAAEQARIDAEVAKQLEAEKAKEILAQQKAEPIAEMQTDATTPGVSNKPASTKRPKDNEIILTIATVYHVDYSTAESWIMEMQSRMVAA